MVTARIALSFGLALLPAVAVAQEVKLGSTFNAGNQSGPVTPAASAIIGGSCLDGSACTIPIYGFAGTSSVVAFRAGGTNIAKTALASGDMIGSYDFYGWNGTAYVLGGRFSCSASAAWTGSVNTLGCQISANTSGTVTSGNTLSIVGTDAAAVNLGLFSFGGAVNVTGTRANGTAAAPTPIASGDTLASVGFRGYTGSANSTANNGFSCSATEAWTTTANGANCALNYTVAGTTAVKAALRWGDADVFGVPTRQAALLAGTAAGTDITGALALTADLNFITTVASGSGVLIAPYSTAQATAVVQRQEIFNAGANALNVYPPSTSVQIKSGTTTGAAGAAVSLAAGGHGTFYCTSTTLCYQGP